MMNPDGSADGVRVQHYIAGGVYTKEAHIEAGWYLEGHKHTYDHLSLLAYGQVIVTVDGMEQLYTGPTGIKIVAGKEHKIQALTKSLWYCVHAVAADLRIDTAEAALVALG